MSKKRRRKRVKVTECDRHHLLYYRRDWETGYKGMLRRAFVYRIPKEAHKQLHTLAPGIPPLNEVEAKELWARYKALEGSRMGLYEAFEWLADNTTNDEFKSAITTEYAVIRYCL